MIFDRWDPGIRLEAKIRLGLQQKVQTGTKSNQGRVLERSFLSDLGWIDQRKGNESLAKSGESWKDGSTNGRSVLIKTKSSGVKGMRCDLIKSQSRLIDLEVTQSIPQILFAGFWKLGIWLWIRAIPLLVWFFLSSLRDAIDRIMIWGFRSYGKYCDHGDMIFWTQ